MEIKITLQLKDENKTMDCEIYTTTEEFNEQRSELSKNLSYFFRDLNKPIKGEVKSEVKAPVVQVQEPIQLATPNQIEFIKKYLHIIPNPDLTYNDAFQMIKDFKVRNGWRLNNNEN